MGKLSDKKRAAGRPGKRERERAKRNPRHNVWASVGGSGSYHVKAGRKKFDKVWAYVRRVVEAHHGGESLTSKSAAEIKRPLYTISAGRLVP